jgi:hypothetical protein
MHGNRSASTKKNFALNATLINCRSGKVTGAQYIMYVFLSLHALAFEIEIYGRQCSGGSPAPTTRLQVAVIEIRRSRYQDRVGKSIIVEKTH